MTKKYKKNNNGVVTRRDGKGDVILQLHRNTLPKTYYVTDIDGLLINNNGVCGVIDNKYTVSAIDTEKSTYRAYNTIANMIHGVMLITVPPANQSYYVKTENNIQKISKPIDYIAQATHTQFVNTEDKIYVEYTYCNNQIRPYAIIIRDTSIYQYAQQICNKINMEYKTDICSVYYIDDALYIHKYDMHGTILQSVQLGTDSWLAGYASIGIEEARNRVKGVTNETTHIQKDKR